MTIATPQENAESITVHVGSAAFVVIDMVNFFLAMGITRLD
jgi:hypothetical protein